MRLPSDAFSDIPFRITKGVFRGIIFWDIFFPHNYKRDLFFWESLRVSESQSLRVSESQNLRIIFPEKVSHLFYPLLDIEAILFLILLSKLY